MIVSSFSSSDSETEAIVDGVKFELCLKKLQNRFHGAAYKYKGTKKEFGNFHYPLYQCVIFCSEYVLTQNWRTHFYKAY